MKGPPENRTLCDCTGWIAMSLLWRNNYRVHGREEIMLEIGWAQIVNDHICRAMNFGIDTIWHKESKPFMYGSTISYLGFTKLSLEAVWKMDWNGGRDDRGTEWYQWQKDCEVEMQSYLWITAPREREDPWNLVPEFRKWDRERNMWINLTLRVSLALNFQPTNHTF